MLWRGGAGLRRGRCGRGVGSLRGLMESLEGDVSIGNSRYGFLGVVPEK
jgi:hypothetical protein